jgi:hypothetical protein
MSVTATFFRRWCAEQGADPQFAEVLLEECPWLDGRSEINDELADQLLFEPFATGGLRQHLPAFVKAYNEFVLESSGVRHPAREAAYAAMCRVLEGFGQNGAFGESDFWLVDDSFSFEKPMVVVVNSRFRFPDEVLEQLSRAAAACPFFSEVVIGDGEGNVLQAKAIPRDGD